MTDNEPQTPVTPAVRRALAADAKPRGKTWTSLTSNGASRAVLRVATSRPPATLTLLMKLSMRGNIKGVQRCFDLAGSEIDLDQAIDVEADDDSACKLSLTPLGAAVCSGMPEIVGMILSRGASPNLVAGSRELAPLHLAAGGSNANAGVVKQLLLAAANAQAISSDGSTPLLYACQGGYVECAAVLLEHPSGLASLPTLSNQGASCVLAAATRGHVECLELLLEYDADPSHGRLVFNAANSMRRRRQEAADGSTNIRWRAPPTDGPRGASEVAWAPLLVGGTSPLYAACKAGHHACVALLLKANAAPNSRSAARDNGATALHVACERAHLGCVKILLEARADVSAMCEATQHETPVDLAWRSTIQGGSPSPSRLPSNSPSRPSSSGGLSRAESTASVSLDPTGFIGAGVTPLFVAAASVDCAELIQLLLEANADVDQASQATLQTPLMVAAMAGHVQVCKSLLKGKADLERTSVFGSSPQELAERCRSLATIKLLKEAAYLLRETGTAEHCGQTLTASEELNLRVTGV